MNLDNYECDGQMHLLLDNFIKPICQYSRHTCNKQSLWEVAHSLDNIICPELCCRYCSVTNCGARCNGSSEPKKEKVYDVDIRGLLDDAFCPKCGYPFDEFKGQVDCERCPECGIRVDWTHWHRMNDDWWLEHEKKQQK